MKQKPTPTMLYKPLFLALLILLTPLISANTFGYNYLNNQPSGNITNEYINNTYINQTLELNSTQFETGEPVTIKESWLTSFIEGISKWANYWTKTENINATGYNISADYFIGNGSQLTGIPSPDLSAYFKLDQTTPQTITGGRPIFNDGFGTPTGNNFIWGDGTRATTSNNIIIGDGSVAITGGGNNIIIGNGITQSGYTYGQIIIGNGAPSGGANSASYGSRTLSGPHQFNNGNVIIGHISNTIDPELKFFANTNTGSIKWWEDENYFQFGNFFVADNIKAMFGTSRDASLYFDGTNMIFNTGTGLAHFSNNVSATGYITRTETFDKSKGNALDLIKDSSELKDSKGEINHSKFYGYVQYDVTDYSKPVNEEICGIIEGKTQCETKTIYPYKKIEEGVNIVSEIELLRQSIYELKEQNEFLQEQINNLTGKDTKLEEANTRQDKALCSIKLFDWCLIK